MRGAKNHLRQAKPPLHVSTILFTHYEGIQHLQALVPCSMKQAGMWVGFPGRNTASTTPQGYVGTYIQLIPFQFRYWKTEDSEPNSLGIFLKNTFFQGRRKCAQCGDLLKKSQFYYFNYFTLPAFSGREEDIWFRSHFSRFYLFCWTEFLPPPQKLFFLITVVISFQVPRRGVQ